MLFLIIATISTMARRLNTNYFNLENIPV